MRLLLHAARLICAMNRAVTAAVKYIEGVGDSVPA
jgi:hypothetical protein